MAVIYVSSLRDLAEDTVHYYASHLPPALHSRYKSFKFQRHARLFLIGKLLLRHALINEGFVELSLDKLLWSRQRRPYFNSEVDFNISHSGEYTTCAISTTCRLGIDIEEIKPVPMDHYKTCWSRRESSIIEMNGIDAFYDLWTRKESVLKAAGTGLIDNLSSFDVVTNHVEFNGERWYMHRVQSPQGYKMHLAVNSGDEHIRVPRPVKISENVLTV